MSQQKMSSSTPESSPTRRMITRTDGRASRPRKRFEDEHYVHSISQSGLGSNLRSRRQSDPGAYRISSLSPLRYRVKIDRDISEDGGEEDPMKLHPRLVALKTDCENDPPEDIAYPLCGAGGTRPKTPPHWPHWRRTQRSFSLPMGDPYILEVGEALGAIAVTDPATHMEHLKIPVPPGGPVTRRRRSVSIEMTPMEAIMEDSESSAVKNSRRYSTPVVNTPDVTSVK